MSAHMSTHMVNINISIKKEAYDFLNKFRKDSKSFSDVILDFEKGKNDKENIDRLIGALGNVNIDWNAKERRMKEFRISFNKRMKETAEYMEKSRHMK